MHIDSKGSLIIPDDAEVEVVEPAIVATIKEKKLFQSATTVPMLAAPPRMLADKY